MSEALQGEGADDRLYLVCHSCEIKSGIARIRHWSSTRFYGGAAEALTDHASHRHQFCYEAGLGEWEAYSWGDGP